MAVIPKLVLDFPQHHVEIRRFHMKKNELIFIININGVDLCTATWAQKLYWKLRECSITFDDMHDIVLPAIIAHVKKHAHGTYIAQGLQDDSVNKNMLFAEFKSVLSY